MFFAQSTAYPATSRAIVLSQPVVRIVRRAPIPLLCAALLPSIKSRAIAPQSLSPPATPNYFIWISPTSDSHNVSRSPVVIVVSALCCDCFPPVLSSLSTSHTHTFTHYHDILIAVRYHHLHPHSYLYCLRMLSRRCIIHPASVCPRSLL